MIATLTPWRRSSRANAAPANPPPMAMASKGPIAQIGHANPPGTSAACPRAADRFARARLPVPDPARRFLRLRLLPLRRRQVLEGGRGDGAADDAGNPDLDVAHGAGRDASQSQDRLARRPPPGEVPVALRALGFELVDRGERVFADLGGLEGL